ncbi:MAG TPA: hypothetical protein VHM88_02270, partial [Candidatus Acidoferrales bacterium]|nr:hypothetical protein [Candidatus Acidoferrales bacterium]
TASWRSSMAGRVSEGQNGNPGWGANMKIRSSLVCLLLLGAAAGTVDWSAEGKHWWAHVQYLADDKLEGRETGSEGHRKAAAYVEDRFREYSLKPAGTAGYLQPVRFDVRQIDEEHSSIELFENRKYVPLKLGEDLSVSLRTNPPARLEAPAVFVGYALSIPEAHYDDFAGLDLTGKIAVHLAGGPSSVPGPLRAHYSSGSERWKALERAGAAGLVVIQNPKFMDIPWSRASLARFQASMGLADRNLKEAPDQKLSLTLNPERADRWIRSSGDHTLTELLALADAGKPLPRFNLGVKLRAKITVKRWQVESQNVVGVLPGSDAKLKNEYVAVSAHLRACRSTGWFASSDGA